MYEIECFLLYIWLDSFKSYKLTKLKFESYIGLDNDDIRAYPNNIEVFSLEDFTKELSQELLWIEAKDIWYVE